MLFGDAVGKIGVAACEQPPGDDLALVPPRCGPHRIAWINLESRGCLLSLFPFPQPTNFVIEEPWIGAQPCRNTGDKRIPAAGACMASARRASASA